MGKSIVVSAINIVDGGALTVLQDAIISFDAVASSSDKVKFLVASPEVHKKIKTRSITFEYFPSSKKSWILRFFFEYVYFLFYSLKRKPDIWLSLHDTTPSVFAKERHVYCHNPSIFLDFPLRDILLDKKQFVFSLLYKYLYKINIRKNTSVITQQAWMADSFSKIFKIDNLIVAEPDTTDNTSNYTNLIEPAEKKNGFNLFYPAYPRYFKNHAVIFEASNKVENVNFWLTLDGSENKYSRELFKKHPTKNIELMGIIPREKVFELYQNCDALVFPSLLETWGLPLTEFKKFNKPIIAADLPYAHETLGNYEKIYWFSPHSSESLLQAINRAKLNSPADPPKPVTCTFQKLIGWKNLALHLLGR